jgi:RNA polymerase sigma-70 factor (ECF subfamily)
VAAIFREEAAVIHGSLMRWLRDFALVDEVLQDAILKALETWPVDGIPDRPGAWLLTVARRTALNRLGREANHRDKLSGLEPESAGEPEDRLRLIFTCCHPALAREAQVALTLRTICGFTEPEIARALMTSEAGCAQRLVRARRKIVDAGIPYAVPREEDMPARLGEVLAVLYLMFNEGHLSSQPGAPFRRDLAEDAVWLTELVCRLMPSHPEILGLLALMKLHLARADARFDGCGRIVLLRAQDRRLWDRTTIEEAIALLERAARLERPGPYQIEAAIAACHAEAPSYSATDWAQVLALYDLLLALTPTPVVRLHRAVVSREVLGAEAALSEVEELAKQLEHYHLFHAVRADLLAAAGRQNEALSAHRRALELVRNQAERSLLELRLLAHDLES